MMRFATISTLTFLHLSGPAIAGNLAGDQIKALVSGKSAIWKSADGKYSGMTKYGTDGSQFVAGNFSGVNADSGNWRVLGDNLCTKWQRVRKGEEKCYPIEDLGGGNYQFGSSLLNIK